MRRNKPYDIKAVISEVVDDGEFMEVHPFWAMNIVCGYARLDGHVVGIVGNQPRSSRERSTSTRRRRRPGSCGSATRSTSRW